MRNELEMENWQREQLLRMWREKEKRKTEIVMGDCIKRATDKKEFETADRERSEREVIGRKNTMETEFMVNDRDEKKTTISK